MDAAAASGIVIIILVVGSIGFYFLPFAIALIRRRHNTVAIFALNLLLGWTLIGWVVALVWSLTSTPPAAPPPAA